jgi:hypothetical protein
MLRRALAVLSIGGFLAVSHAEDSKTVKLLWENQFVQVYELRVPPGVFEPKHSHGKGVTIALTAYDNELKSIPDGKITKRHTEFGETRWAETVTHEGTNTGKTEQRVIRVEMKQDQPPVGSQAIRPTDPLDSLIACKDTQRLIFENAFVRVIEEKVPAGVAQPKHRHAKGVLVPLANSKIESVDEGAKPVHRELKFGDAGWRDPVVHSVKNEGTTELRNIRIELK